MCRHCEFNTKDDFITSVRRWAETLTKPCASAARLYHELTGETP